VTVVAFGPEVCVGLCSDQLRRNPNSLPRPQHSTFHNAVHLEFTRNLSQICGHLCTA